jgi:hypothetical protein
MRFLVAVVAALALAPAAAAADVSMVVRDVPLHASARTLQSAPPRFNLVALHWQGAGTPLFRTRGVSGRWSAWQAADDDWGRRGPWREQSNPAWTGAANAIQYRREGVVTKLRAYFLWSPAEQTPSRRLTIAGGPTIIPREGWEADESIRRAPPVYADALRFALVHHTVTANSYTRAQSAAIVRGIEIYHVKGNGWNDIGYNFLVDKYGQIFEGRYGGVDRNVVGAHSQGFNTGSVGVAVIGTYNSVKISSAAKSALEQLLAWRLDLAHVDPLASVKVVSGGNSKFRAGKTVTLRAISGHRDTYSTECPGNALYAQLPGIATAVAAIGLPKLYAPTVSGKLGGPIHFTGTLTTALPWTVTVVSSASGLVVASGSGVGTAIDWTWDSTAAPGGSYTWRIDAGSAVRPATGSLGSGGKAPPFAITGSAATPAVTATSTTISYTLTAPALVTATLLDPSGTAVSELFSDERPAGKQSFSFVLPPTLPDGVYTVSLDAQSATGQDATASVTVQVDRTVGSFTVTPSAISPNGDGVQDTATVSFTLAAPASVTVELDHDGVPVATLAEGTYGAGTPVTATWDGTIGGAPAADGSYSIVLLAGAVRRSADVTVDTTAPSLRPLSWARLRFSLSEPGTLTLVAGGHSYVKKVRKPGPASFWLRTKPSSYTVTALDLAGNATTLQKP